MVRPKGGRANPRYFFYKKSAEDRLVSLLTETYEMKKEKRIETVCKKLEENMLLADKLIILSKQLVMEIRKICSSQ